MASASGVVVASPAKNRFVYNHMTKSFIGYFQGKIRNNGGAHDWILRLNAPEYVTGIPYNFNFLVVKTKYDYQYYDNKFWVAVASLYEGGIGIKIPEMPLNTDEEVFFSIAIDGLPNPRI